MADVKSLFVDTNVLIYASIAEAPFHLEARAALEAAHLSARPLWLNRQVLREFIAVRTRPQVFERPSTIETLVERVRYFETYFNVADDTAAVTSQLLRLLATIPTGGKQVHDANIVATMLAYDIPALLTFNTRDFERFSHYIIVEAGG